MTKVIAKISGHYICPHCGWAITPDDRKKECMLLCSKCKVMAISMYNHVRHIEKAQPVRMVNMEVNI